MTIKMKIIITKLDNSELTEQEIANAIIDFIKISGILKYVNLKFVWDLV